MNKFLVFEADVWPDGNSFSVNMYYPLIENYTGKQLTIELSDDSDDIDIINTLINNQIIDDNILNQDDYTINIEYLYNDIIVTINDLIDTEATPIIIELCEV